MASGRRKTRRFYIAVVIVIAAAMLVVILFMGRIRSWSVDRQIAQIEAARAIPDSENAAVMYRQFFKDFEGPDPLLNGMLIDQVHMETVLKPWRSSDHPEQAALIKENSEALSKLIEITKTEKCCWPIRNEPAHLPRRGEMPSGWFFFLNRAMSNDIGDGRIDAAIEKYACTVRLAGHWYQQPSGSYYFRGARTELFPTGNIIRLIVGSDISDAQLERLSEATLPAEDTFASKREEIRRIDALSEAKGLQQLSFLERIKYWFKTHQAEDIAERNERSYYRMLAVRRGLYILVALRRFRNQQGHWPENLDVIAPLLPTEILNDTEKCGSFIYKTVGDDFVLYGTGSNGTDEGGVLIPPDDVPIWPTGRMLHEIERKKENAK